MRGVSQTAAAAATAGPRCRLPLLTPAPLAPLVAAHTLGNALRDVMWAHPHVQLASYTQEHPSSTDIILRCQTTGAISAEQGVVEALQMTQGILRHMASTMDAAVEEWQQRQDRGGGKQQQQRQQQQQRPGGDAMDED
jgi:DNA-directed RNA polymerase subunit L